MPDNATRMIERQIAIELDRLNSIFPDEDEKAIIIQRIADLKAMIDSSSEQKEEKMPSIKEIFVEAIHAWRYRR